jgi:hypothetical protein
MPKQDPRPQWMPGVIRCPDCSGVEDAMRHLRHDQTCPFGLGLDEQMDDDRVWFEQHPGEVERVRPIFHAERQEQLMYGASAGQIATHVRVTQIRPGLRARQMLVYVEGGLS